MSPSAALALATPDLVTAPLPIFNGLRDFSQPWMDLNDKSVLVTGGTGSFGKHFIKTVIANYKPKRLIIFSRDELKQFEMQQDFPLEKYPFIRYFIGDVRDKDRLEMALNGVDFVVHAAAMKQVTTAEYNPFECIRTNVFGAENVVSAAIRCGVKRVVALSTDKAANPINLYGASKLASDKIFVAANNLAGADGTRFSVVRERMTRFWITLTQGVNFVLSSMEMMKGGEIYVPKIPSTTIPQLAGLVSPTHKTHVVGIRPGEKLHETMIPADDAHCTVELEDRYVILQSFANAARDAYLHRGGKPVADGFSYSSDTNPEQLDSRGLQNLLAMAYA
jgi:UDP-N-acetylglucosamine 4,6-dehydratase